MQTRKSTTKKPLRAVVGSAHHALRAYAKAYDLRSGAGAPHRYSIPEDGLSASILDANGNEVETRRIEEWAAIGPSVRRAMLALRFFQELSRAYAAAHAQKPPYLRYYLNILEGRACLLADGQALSTDALRVLWSLTPELNSAETLSDWARIGKAVEVDFFQRLQSAERYKLKPAAAELREAGYRLGIIRKPKSR